MDHVVLSRERKFILHILLSYGLLPNMQLAPECELSSLHPLGIGRDLEHAVAERIWCMALHSARSLLVRYCGLGYEWLMKLLGSTLVRTGPAPIAPSARLGEKSSWCCCCLDVACRSQVGRNVGDS